MKIISKYKDFYDYSWIDSDPDLVYVRKPKVCFQMPNIESTWGKHIGEGVRNYYIRHAGYVSIVGYTFGIYPNIYTVPAVYITTGETSYRVKLLSKDEVEYLSLLKDKKDIQAFFRVIFNNVFDKQTYVPDMTLTYPLEKRPYEEVMRYCWKEYNPQVFLDIESPIFVLYDYDVLGHTYEYLMDVKYCQNDIDKIQIIKNCPVYKDPLYSKVMPKLVTNICLNKLDLPIYKYWFDDLANIYSDIENFLMTSKLDPEPKISNEGKIIAHGFDLKTSFRKM